MILKNATIVNSDEIIENGYVKIHDGKIVEIGTDYSGEGLDLEGKYVLPGFIEMHIHGTNGVDVMDGTSEALDNITANLVKEGTTSFLPTTLTHSKEKIKQAIRNIVSYQGNPSGAKIIGIHLEGPYIDIKYKGAQNESYIQEPLISNLQELLDEACGMVKKITYACEKSSVDFTSFVVENGIIPSIGHSSASMEEVLNHVDYGLKHITHFHNGQSPHHHRNPGVVSAGLYSDKLTTELIVDGIHLHKDVVKLVNKVKTKHNIILVTDSMRAKGLKNGFYTLGGLDVEKTDSEVRTLYGSLAGSILKMSDAVKNYLEFTGCSLKEIVSITSLNQARHLKLDDQLGKVEAGYIADLVVLDKEYNLMTTIRDGVVVYSAKKLA